MLAARLKKLQASKFKKTVDDSASEFLCPITQELPIDPVTAEDGRVYERQAIETWLGKERAAEESVASTAVAED